MRRFLILSIGTLLIQFFAVAALAQQAAPTQSAPATSVAGRWKGSFQVPGGGEMEMTATFKKDKEAYTGTIAVAEAQAEKPFKSVKVDGDQIKAQAEFETPNGNMVVNYSFTLKDDTLKGKGEVDFGGQNMAFDVNLKRATENK